MIGLRRGASLALVLLCAIPVSAQFERDGIRPAGPGVQARHYLLRREQPLREAERMEMGRKGIEIVQPLGGNNYVVRATGNAARGILQEIGPSAKLSPSAGKEVASARPFARLKVVFHRDVSFDEARRAVERAGASPEQPFLTRFGPLHSIEVSVPQSGVAALATADQVFQIHGARRRITPDNSAAATMSHVSEVLSAPYDLSGRGVSISMWDCGVAQATHQEFGGRLTLHDPGTPIHHPTHVAGTVGASGINPQARGMAPQVTMHQFALPECVGGGNGRPFLDAKNEFFPSLGISVDNNSWSYVVGWHLGSDGLWTFYDNHHEFGLYDFDSAAVDHIAREHDTLMVFSAGNDADDTGPLTAPFAHKHGDDETVTWCVSSDGSGTDCGTGCGRCEVGRHPVDGPFPSVGVLGMTKNVLAVGAVQSSRLIAGFSSRGPAADGRIKPDVVTKGTQVLSTLSNGGYGTSQGTSMSTPVVTGIAALLVEQWRRTEGADPLPQMLRALIIHGTEDLGNPGPDYTYGFGLVNARNSVDAVRADNSTGSFIRTGTLAQGARMQIPVTVNGGTGVRLTMVWNDVEAIPLAQVALVNDLDMRLVAPSGAVTLPWVLNAADREAPATRGVNSRDTVEMIELPDAPAGVYTLEISGTRVNSSEGQSFALVSNSQFGDSTPSCSDLYEPNDTGETVFGPLVLNSTVTAKTCTSTDVDLYSILVNESGPVSVAISAGDMPLRATLSGGTTTVSMDVAAGSHAVLQSAAGAGSGGAIQPVTFLLRVESIGAAGNDRSYSITPAFGFSSPRRRGVGR